MSGEEEILIEIEAVQSVYGDDCVVIDNFPPHLHVHIKPRTADVFSQQFVDAIIGIRAGPQYPDVPPSVQLMESRGLDDERKKKLIGCIREKALQFSPCSMLVALCEEAVEVLSAMNHPDGDCPLCLYPLLSEDKEHQNLPFMKLMSCFHCFHCDCIIQWWNWLQIDKQTDANDLESQRGLEESTANCPVCRKVFQSKDLEHVLDLVGSYSLKLSSDREDVDEKLLQSDSENTRRQKFETIMKIQQENKGLIEAKKELVVLPGMYVTPPVTSSSYGLTEDVSRHQQSRHATTSSERDSSIKLKQRKEMVATSEFKSTGSSNVHSAINHRNSAMRKNKVKNARKQVGHWVRREHTSMG